MACALPTRCLYPFERFFISLSAMPPVSVSFIAESAAEDSSRGGIPFAAPTKRRYSRGVLFG